ncbi:MAG: Gfo/Idh/MocA family oxidoreductase [Candidatus Omnitrophota bacterium]|nr:Gfo/Idh/MocA family oxidoreductase [Candidatus Omnitrophota bacterium]
MQNLKVGVIGVGHLGEKHARIYSKLLSKVNLVGICDINEQRLKEVGTQFAVGQFNNHLKLLDKVEAVSICVPTNLHASIAKDFLSNECCVLVEKPITPTLQEADELISLAKKKNLILQVGHVERFNSAYQAIKVLAKNPKFVECHRLSPFPNRSLDIGVVLDLMIHDIDIILGLVESKISDIQAVGVKVLTDYEDIANARITFKNGCVSNLTASRVSNETMRKIRLFLKETYISLDYCLQEAFIYKKLGKLISKHSLPIEKEEPLKKELESFVDCVSSHQKPLVSGIEGRAALELALKIIQKIWK